MAQNEILLKIRGTSDFSDIQSDVKTLQNYFGNLKLPKNITKDLDKNFEELDKELQKFQQHMNSGFKTKSDVTGLEKSGKKIVDIFSRVQNVVEGIDTATFKNAFQVDTSDLTEAQNTVTRLKKELSEKINADITVNSDGQNKIVNLKKSVDELFKNSKAKQRLINFKEAINSGDIESAKKQLGDLKTYANSVFSEDSVKGNAFKAALQDIGLALDNMGNGDNFNKIAEELKQAEIAADRTEKEIDQLKESAQTSATQGLERLAEGARDFEKSAEQAAQSQQSLNSEISQVKDQISYYFSLINVAQLLRRAFQDVYNTVKELDEVMTETAVVTDFSIGDMWDKLPEYTAQAKALGVATKDLYAATTLYYQQGLDSNASMAAGVETMKMARIAGMEASAATDAMTAALRGFNMEVNETNAQNVNDVYSKLAAITASDTEEIATAMSKTAAIANSVGAEFENIAVFLAQGIETTRESADAIGTAMKTILARFNEMKKDPSEIGEIDGEIVDANKVETALRSVGIALRDSNGEFRNADKVLLEVAKKWNTMSVMQQRYIATTAAGSRQQSRFIAFMQDYNRTVELQEAAYDASGAAQAQYEKTLESLDSKMARLKDTWDEYILGIANSDVIKAGVDILSTLLDVINQLTNSSNSLTNGIQKIFVAFTLFRGAKALVNYFTNSIVQGFARAGQQAGLSFQNGLNTGLNNLNKSSKTTNKALSSFRSIRKELNMLGTQGSQSLGELSTKLGSLSSKTLSGLTTALGPQLYNNLTSSLKQAGVTIDDAGAEWGQRVINEFIQEINQGTGVDAAINNLQGKIEAQFANSDGVIPNIGENFVKDLQVDPTQFVKDTKMQNRMKSLDKWGMAISGLGMGISTIGQKLEELDGSMGKFGEGLQVVGESATSAGMALTILPSILTTIGISATAAFGWAIGIAAVIAGITAAISFVQKQKEAVEEARKASIEVAQTSAEEAKANRELANSFDEVVKSYEEGIATKKELAEASEDLAKKYDLEGYKAELAAGKYENFQKAVEKARLEEEETNIKNQELAIDSVRGSLYGKLEGLKTISYGASTSDEVNVKEDDDFDKEIDELITEFELGSVGLTIGSEGQLYIDKAFSEFTDEELANFSKFSKKYMEKLGALFSKQSKTMSESEIYQALSSIVGLGGETSEDFDTLISLMESQKESQDEIGFTYYNKEKGEIVDKESYEKERDKLIEYLTETQKKESDKVKQQAIDYFVDQGYSEASADSFLLKIETELDGEKENIDIVKKYINGEIDAETFVKIIGQVEISKAENAEDFNSLINESIAKGQLYASDNFLKASKKINDYINENYTIKDIEQSVLDDFESFLNSLKGVIPEGIDLLASWNQALQQGTIGIASFMANLQGVLGEQSSQMQMNWLYQKAYGIPFDEKTILAFWDEYQQLNDKDKEDYRKNLGFETEQKFFEAQMFAGARLGINKGDLKTEEDVEDYIENTLLTDAENKYHKELFTKKNNKTISAIGDAYGAKFRTWYNEASESDRQGMWTQDETGKWLWDSDAAYEQAKKLNKNQDSSTGEVLSDSTVNKIIKDYLETGTLGMLNETAAGASPAVRQMMYEQVQSSIEKYKEDKIESYNEDLKDYEDWDYVSTNAYTIDYLDRLEDREEIEQQVSEATARRDYLLQQNEQKQLTEEEVEEYFSLDGSLTTGDLYFKMVEINDTIAEYERNPAVQNMKEILEEKAEYEEGGAIDIKLDGMGTALQQGLEGIEGVSAGIEKNLNDASDKIQDTADTFHQEMVDVTDQLDAFSNQEKYFSSMDIANAKQMAQQLGTIQKQWAKVQELTKDGPQINLETFNELIAIMPEIGNGAINLKNGLIDVSYGLNQVEEGTLKNIEAKKEDTVATLENEKAQLHAVGIKLRMLKTILEGEEDKTEQVGNLSEDEQKLVTAAVDDGVIDRLNITDEYETDMQTASNNTTNVVLKNVDEMTQGYAVMANTIAACVDNTEALKNGGDTKVFEKGYSIYDFITVTREDETGNDIDYEEKYKDLLADALKTDNSGLSDFLDKYLGTADREDFLNYVNKMLTTVTNAENELSLLIGGIYDTYDDVNKDGSDSDKLKDIDSLFNILQKIAKVQEEINRLEKEYSSLVDEEIPNLEEIEENIKKRLASLLEEKKLLAEKGILQSAILAKWIQDNKDLSKYVWYDDKLGKIQIEAELINQVEDKELRDEINDVIEEGKKLTEDIVSTNEELFDTEQKIAELQQAGANQLDKSFNILERIERIENELVVLEEKREALMEKTEENSKAILETYKKEKELLEQQVKAQEKLNNERMEQYNSTLAEVEANGWTKYVIEVGNGEFNIDNSAIDKLSKEEQDQIKKIVDLLNEAGKSLNDSEKELNDANKKVREFKKNLQDNAFNFFDEIKNIIIENYQKEIDRLNQENEAIGDAETKLFDSIQKSLSEQRQERENQKTIEDIQDKEARLAYLRADTTGANDLEIKNLEKELSEQKEDFTDTLIDQKISELQQQNEEAAAQREVQISLAEAQLEEAQRSGEINQKVQELINNGVNVNSAEIKGGSELEKLIKASADYTGLTADQQQAYWKDLMQNFNEYASYIGLYKKVGTKDNEEFAIGTDVTSKIGGLPEGAKATVTGEGQVTIQFTNESGEKKSLTFDDVTSDTLDDINLSTSTGGKMFTAIDARKVLRHSAGLEKLSEKDLARYDLNRDGKINAIDARLILRNAAQMESFDFGEDYYGLRDFYTMIGLLEEEGYDSLYDFDGDNKLTNKDLEELVNNFGVPKKFYKFATGGLADFTGPAWLDGTKSRPEMVLNQRDTENFIQLKDILSSVMKNIGSKKSDEKTGDVYYEIHIDVEKLTSDYDVDDVANRVKTIISQDAMYRNTNIINRLR